MSDIPEKFFQVTNDGQLLAFINEDSRLVEDSRPSPSAVPDDDDESRYWILPPGRFDDIGVARYGDTMAFPLEAWNELGFWTTDEKIARIVQASLRRGVYFGVSKMREGAEKEGVAILRTFKT